MPAPKGNEYYKVRLKDGRSKTYTPAGFINVSNEYFEWCIDNPLKEQKLFHYQGAVTKEYINKLRVFSIQGLCNFATITRQTFLNYEKDKEYLEVVTHVRGRIENQQFEGATAELFNPNIIARKLGLSDKKELKADIDVKTVTGMTIK